MQDRGRELDIAEDRARVFVVAGGDAAPLLQMQVPVFEPTRAAFVELEGPAGVCAGQGWMQGWVDTVIGPVGCDGAVREEGSDGLWSDRGSDR